MTTIFSRRRPAEVLCAVCREPLALDETVVTYVDVPPSWAPGWTIPNSYVHPACELAEDRVDPTMRRLPPVPLREALERVR